MELMNRRTPIPFVVALIVLGTIAAAAHAEVAGYYVRISSPGHARLLGVTAGRGSGRVTFDAAKLIGVRLLHFKATEPSNVITVPGSGPPVAGRRGVLLSDGLLNTGIINPGGAQRALSEDPVLAGPNATPGMAVEFSEPVLNLSGDDVVLFEFHRRLGSPPGGDAFHVSPLRFAAGLRSITVDRFDFDVDDRRVTPIGAFDLIYELPAGQGRLSCNEPRPLRPRRREPLAAPRVDLAKRAGRLILNDVYHGRNMGGVARGEIKRLLVLEQLPKPISFSGGMWPISVGGTFTLARVLGTVPVEPDGSADFEVPALRPLFFVALDENDLSVKRMQSFVSLQPGETTGCVGCHERRLQPPLAATGKPAFVGRKPHKIAPIKGVPDVLDFPRDVQPILDRHCVACHNPDQPGGQVDLCGDHSPLFSQSYWAIMQHGLIADGRNERYGDRPPRDVGSSASRLMELIDGSHYDAMPTDKERRIVRVIVHSGRTGVRMASCI